MYVAAWNLSHAQVESMLAKYEWIATDRQYFGQPNTAYDFNSSNNKDVSRRLAKLQEQKVSVNIQSVLILVCSISFLGQIE